MYCIIQVVDDILWPISEYVLLKRDTEVHVMSGNAFCKVHQTDMSGSRVYEYDPRYLSWMVIEFMNTTPVIYLEW